MDTVQQAGEGRASAGQALERWFETDPRGRLILTDDLELLWCNGAAREFLGGGQGLVLRAGAVRPRDAALATSFAQFVRKAGDRLSAYCLPPDDGDRRLVVAARRLDGTGLVALTAHHASADSEHHWADLSQAFGLTASERDIAQALGSGLTAEAIADTFHISVKTVRTHIRHVYSKLDVSSREELFHKLSPYMLVD